MVARIKNIVVYHIGFPVKYHCGYSENEVFDYEISHVWRDSYGKIAWVDLRSKSPDIKTHFSEHLSVSVTELNHYNQ